MSGLIASSQSNNRSCRLRSELMFHETIFISREPVGAVHSNRLGDCGQSPLPFCLYYSRLTIPPPRRALAQSPPSQEAQLPKYPASTRPLVGRHARGQFCVAKCFLRI